ncbi:MAG: spondin domain-containing protein [Chloroflexota bacterium]
MPLSTDRKFSLRTGLSVAVLVLLAIALVSVSSANASNTRTYEVTIINLTDGQYFTPPVVTTASSSFRLFQRGKEASEGVREIAENGNLDPLLAALEGDSEVTDFAVALSEEIPPLAPGSIISTQVEAYSGDRLSLVSMLICTNDGFTGRNRLRLPNRVGNTNTFALPAYDAGTEINTEDFADIVPPCPALTGFETDDAGTGMSNPALAENGVIEGHPGIAGVSDLDPAVHDWVGATGVVVITRVK